MRVLDRLEQMLESKVGTTANYTVLRVHRFRGRLRVPKNFVRSVGLL